MHTPTFTPEDAVALVYRSINEADDFGELRALADRIDAPPHVALMGLMAVGAKELAGCSTQEAVEAAKAHLEGIVEDPAFKEAMFWQVWHAAREMAGTT